MFCLMKEPEGYFVEIFLIYFISDQYCLNLTLVPFMILNVNKISQREIFKYEKNFIF